MAKYAFKKYAKGFWNDQWAKLATAKLATEKLLSDCKTPQMRTDIETVGGLLSAGSKQGPALAEWRRQTAVYTNYSSSVNGEHRKRLALDTVAIAHVAYLVYGVRHMCKHDIAPSILSALGEPKAKKKLTKSEKLEQSEIARVKKILTKKIGPESEAHRRAAQVILTAWARERRSAALLQWNEHRTNFCS